MGQWVLVQTHTNSSSRVRKYLHFGGVSEKREQTTRRGYTRIRVSVMTSKWPLQDIWRILDYFIADKIIFNIIWLFKEFTIHILNVGCEKTKSVLLFIFIMCLLKLFHDDILFYLTFATYITEICIKCFCNLEFFAIFLFLIWDMRLLNFSNIFMSFHVLIEL